MNKVDYLHIGSLQLECFTISSPDASAPESFKKEGINHVCFSMLEVQEETAQLFKKGFKIPFTLIADSIIYGNFIGSDELDGIILSLRQPLSDGEQFLRRHMPSSDWRFRGLGIAVSDLDKATEFYQSLGIVDFQPEAVFDSTSLADFELNGQTPGVKVKARVRAAQVGPLLYEFVQPLQEETIYRGSLERRGNGVNDLCLP
jgi:hypothetical protein